MERARRTPVALPQLLLGALLALPAGAPLAAAQGPFESGPRWQVTSPSASPAIPRAAAAVGGGELFAVGWSLGHPALALLGGAAGDAEPLAVDNSYAGALGALQVGARGPDQIYSLAQYALAGGARRTELRRHRASAAPGAFVAEARVDLPGSPAGAAQLVVPPAGEHVVVARHDPALGRVRLETFVGAGLVPLLAMEVQGASLRALAADDTGSRLALASGTRLDLFEGSGALLFSAPLDFSSDALALSGDGRTLAVGAQGRLRIWRETAGVWAELPGPQAGPFEIPTALALSADGTWLAVGWWDTLSGKAARAETHDLTQGLRLHVHQQTGAPWSKQNTVSAARISAGGQRAAFAFWGQGGAEPEVLLYDRHQSQPILGATLTGSALAIALDASGTRLLAAHKATHANDVSNSGSAVLFDTGERAVQLERTPVVGGSSALLHAGSGPAIGLVGQPAAALGWPGVEGALLVDPLQPHCLWPLVPQAAGHGAFAFDVPNQPALAGLEFQFQVLEFVPALRFGAAGPRVTLL